MQPNETQGGGIGDWPMETPAWVGEIANYSCPEGQATKMGTFNTSISCLEDGNWTIPDISFQCYNGMFRLGDSYIYFYYQIRCLLIGFRN